MSMVMSMVMAVVRPMMMAMMLTNHISGDKCSVGIGLGNFLNKSLSTPQHFNAGIGQSCYGSGSNPSADNSLHSFSL